MLRVKQVGLLAAGCQPWNKDVCAASGDRFAYCATLAIYIYQVRLVLFKQTSYIFTLLPISLWTLSINLSTVLLEVGLLLRWCLCKAQSSKWCFLHVMPSAKDWDIYLKLYVSSVILKRQALSSAVAWGGWGAGYERRMKQFNGFIWSCSVKVVFWSSLIHCAEVVDSVAHLSLIWSKLLLSSFLNCSAPWTSEFHSYYTSVPNKKKCDMWNIQMEKYVRK